MKKKKTNNGKFILDTSIILQKAYILLCIFFANKEIARSSNPDDENDPLSLLESRFFESEVSRLLLELAIAIRVIDDQVKKLPVKNKSRIEYYALKEEVDKYEYGLFDNINLDLRKTCNKIIHSEVLEPHTSEGSEAHKLDLAASYGGYPREINWEHYNGYVRLAGIEKDTEWFVLLDIEVFVRAIVVLFK